MQKVNIIDGAFSHAFTSSWHNKSNNIEWSRNNHDTNKLIFVTDYNIQNYNNKNHIAWVIEPPSVAPEIYNYIIENNNFHSVLTYEKHLLNVLPNALFYPYGGCWIPEENRHLGHQKSKLVSIIASNKYITEGHKLRHQVIRLFDFKLDLFGKGYNPIEDKGEALYPYYYSIIIENGQYSNYFTEKIIDCFMTGVVPIYWGDSEINKFFNINGIKKFNNILELENILLNLSIEDYKNNLQAIHENFELAKNYLIAEDWIYNQYKHLF